ncbi:iron-containing alcohol dehydrogenase [Psychrobacter cryohalolentis]|uniref:Iron-containing alcohol dehydrogenase n=1 Tax=Psychrobacter cryohalolentis (strain ATCC BAA-1226 / DSM 17306 / VKM B-2378 / K5) TaxID=335284 RepID=Q1QCB5_PSYCK|nr:iron-containing alcohol dehydrogenase [Psychrobacter cryohalolentis]ABE74688.1 iron-containing alcohol dehydrogenase [Psychrobacter cryohalolentis K5]ASE27303.1 alcohol dehydrogenase [Psychrobacter cryohalolentis]
MTGMEFYTNGHIVSEADSMRQKLGDLAKQYDATSAIIITDTGICELGYVDIAQESLEQAGINVVIFDRVVADPPIEVVEEAIELARANQCNLVIGLGGGSPIDTAKIVALYPNDFQSVNELLEADISGFKKMPLFAIPTTAGTGAEATFVSVITAKDGSKKAIYTPKILPDVAILDATLTLKLPRHITAATALDAMVHCIEAYTSRTKKNPISDALAVKGLQMLWSNFYTVLHHGDDIDARADMLLGSTLAGIAFVNASVAAVHGLSYPLSINFHVPHGHANALVMCSVFTFNLPVAAPPYAELARAVMPIDTSGMTDIEAAHQFINQLKDFLKTSGLKYRLNELDITGQDIPALADMVINTYARLIETNPMDMSLEEVKMIYQEIL